MGQKDSDPVRREELLSLVLQLQCKVTEMEASLETSPVCAGLGRADLPNTG